MRSLLITCEHASNAVPARFAAVVNPCDPLLDTHKGFDIGANHAAERIALRHGATLFKGDTSRMVVDLNRSPHNWRRFPEAMRRADLATRRHAETSLYEPYRQRIIEFIEAHLPVAHLSVHSFTPVYEGVSRRTDVAILSATVAPHTKAFGAIWHRILAAALPGLTVHRNQPYTGNQDGLIRGLLDRGWGERYLGVEIEINQRFFQDAGVDPGPMIDRIGDTFVEALGHVG